MPRTQSPLPVPLLSAPARPAAAEATPAPSTARVDGPALLALVAALVHGTAALTPHAAAPHAGHWLGLPPGFVLALALAAVALLAPGQPRWQRVARPAAASGLAVAGIVGLMAELGPAFASEGMLSWWAGRSAIVSLVGPPALSVYALALAVALVADRLRLPAPFVLALQAVSGVATGVCGVGWLLLGIGAAEFGAPAVARVAPGWTVLTLLAAAWNLRLLDSPVRRAFLADRPDRVALLHNLTALAAASFGAGIIGTGVFAFHLAETIAPLLQQSAVAHAIALQRQLQHLSREAASGTQRVGVASTPAEVEAAIRRSLAPHGPPEVHVARELPAGDEPAALAIRSALGVHGWLGPGDSSRVALLVSLPGLRPESVKITFIDKTLSSLLDFRVLDLLAETLTCVPDGPQAARCLTEAGTVTMPLPPRPDGRAWPMQSAWSGQSGVMLTLDRLGEGVAVAYAPVAGWNLGIAHKLGVSALLRALSAQVMLAIAVLGGFALFAAVVVYRRSHAVVSDMRFAKAYVDATFDALPEAVLTLDPDRRIRRASGATSRIVGRAAEQLVGLPLDEVLGPEAAAACRAPGPVPATLHPPGGPRRELEITARPLPFEGREGRVLILRDVTEERQHLESLRRWEGIFRQAGWGAVVVDTASGRIQITNPAFAALYGRTTDDLLGQSFESLFDGDSRSAFAAALASQPAQDRVVLACRHRRADGSSFPVLVDWTVMRSPADAAPVGVAVVQDLSELRRTEQEMQEARRFFEHVFHTAPVGMFVADGHGRLLQANAALAAFLDRPAESLPGAPLHGLVAAEHRDELGAQLASAMGGGERTSPVELPFTVQGRGSAWGLLVMARVQGAGEAPRLVGQVLDIDERRRIAEALRESEAGLAQAEQLAHLGHWRWTPGATTVRCSRQALHILGLPGGAERELVLAEFERRAHPEDLRSVRAAIARVLAGDERAEVDLRIVRPDGSERRVHQMLCALRRAPGEPQQVMGMLLDITDSQRIEHDLRTSRQALRELLANDENALEEERKRISREVHDELGQLLTALRMDVSVLRLKAAAEPATAELAARMLSKIDETIAVTRHVAANLRPASLDLGLVPALEWLAEDLARRSGIACRVSTDGADPVLAEGVSTAVFRMVQECLTNVMRHARASSVHVDLQSLPGRLRLCVRDDGVGFDAQAPRAPGRFGLLGMRERALQAGGTLQIDSTPGHGTRITIDLPTD